VVPAISSSWLKAAAGLPLAAATGEAAGLLVAPSGDAAGLLLLLLGEEVAGVELAGPGDCGWQPARATPTSRPIRDFLIISFPLTVRVDARVGDRFTRW
jgi:hypothetical protein